MDGILQLASTEAGFFDETFLYISGALLVAVALVGSFLGMRKESFPSETQLRALGGITVVLVVCTCIGAIQSARFEQAERRAENEEAAKEAQAEEQGKLEQEAPLGEGEAAQPGTDTGEASSPGEDVGGGAQGGAAVLDKGRELFVQTGCGDCHTLADAGAEGTIGPILDEVLPGQDAEAIRTSIIDPGAAVAEGFPDGTMPTDYSSVFNEVELDTLTAYLAEVAGN